MTDEKTSTTGDDRRDDRRALLTVAGALLVAFSVGAAAQTVFVFQPEQLTEQNLLEAAPGLGIRLFANLTTVAIALTGTAALRLHERRAFTRGAGVTGIALCTSLLRFYLQMLLDIYERPTWHTFGAEVASVFFIIVIALLLGLAQTDARARLRKQERAGARQALRAASALENLNSEELRVRREIAEGLHGTVQNRLVLVGVQLGSIIERRHLSADPEDDVAELMLLREDIDDIRERDVREMSQLLYPAGVGLGVAHAIRLLVQRIPPTIATEVVIDPPFADGDRIDVDRRVVLVRAAEEAITNALKHGNAGSLLIELALAPAGDIRLTVTDDGIGLTRGKPWNGLTRLADRVQAFGGTVSLDAVPPHGAVLRVILPTASPS